MGEFEDAREDGDRGGGGAMLSLDYTPAYSDFDLHAWRWTIGVIQSDQKPRAPNVFSPASTPFSSWTARC